MSILVRLFPWLALRRIELLVRSAVTPDEGLELDLTDAWNRGYERAMSEVGMNLGIER